MNSGLLALQRLQINGALCRATYARVDPAVIVIATCGAQILLGRNVKWPPGRYSALAGFVEIGESLEEAACREVFEESNVKVRICTCTMSGGAGVSAMSPAIAGCILG